MTPIDAAKWVDEFLNELSVGVFLLVYVLCCIRINIGGK